MEKAGERKVDIFIERPTITVVMVAIAIGGTWAGRA
jgi:hypothetical protein